MGIFESLPVSFPIFESSDNITQFEYRRTMGPTAICLFAPLQQRHSFCFAFVNQLNRRISIVSGRSILGAPPNCCFHYRVQHIIWLDIAAHVKCGGIAGWHR
jgi:hypothetical protein